MNRTSGFALSALLSVMIMLATSAMGQQPDKATASHKNISPHAARQSERTALKSGNRTYAPRIEGRSFSFVIEGRITDLEDNVITIKTARGARYDFRLDEQTTVLDSGELVSIATMADISLSAADLRLSDTVEVVAERAGRQEVARIITRIASSGAQVAKR